VEEAQDSRYSSHLQKEQFKKAYESAGRATHTGKAQDHGTNSVVGEASMNFTMTLNGSTTNCYLFCCQDFLIAALI